jgi:signal transduction histidine kinase
MRALAEGRDVRVEVPDPQVARLRTDEVMLTQVLRNLMTNGIKFTPHGEVRLTAGHDGSGMVRLTVADTGIGIPESEQVKVFEEFYQVRGLAQHGAPGTGLGLPYARRLVTLLGGDLSMTSVEGEGTTFVVTLPVAMPEPGALP